MQITPHSTSFKWIAVFWACCSCILLWAVSVSAVELPAGERIVDMAWNDNEYMILLVEEDQSFALRRLELDSGEVSVIQAPRAFTRLSPEDGGDSELNIELAPTGLALAVLEKFGSPLNPPELTVYEIAEDGLEPLNTAKVPRDFYPELMAWSADGAKLYLSARQYLFPGQPFSIGGFDLAGERFSGVSLKANVDLIDSMEFIPQRHSLVVSCRGFHGDYPAQPMIVLINADGVANVLHSQAANHQFHVLASGDALVAASQGEGYATSEELWLLDRNAVQLRSANCIFNGPITDLQTSADGAWLGLLVSSADLDMPDSAEGKYLVLQRATDGKTVITAEPCFTFAFGPTGAQVCTVSPNCDRIEFYNLPE